MSRRIQDPVLLAQIGARLRQARRAAGLTQARLAEMADLQANSVSLMESGALAPTITTIFLLARALGVPARELVDFGADLPTVADGDPEEAHLLHDFRRLDPDARGVVLALMRTLRRAITSK
jgi:transcriptional regulator with XRE-family HTH domain